MIWHAADTSSTASSVIIDGKQYTSKTAKNLLSLLNISERDAERFIRGSDGSVYYTNDHYQTFIKLTK